jgi:hypothetical protein
MDWVLISDANSPLWLRYSSTIAFWDRRHYDIANFTSNAANSTISWNSLAKFNTLAPLTPLWLSYEQIYLRLWTMSYDLWLILWITTDVHLRLNIRDAWCAPASPLSWRTETCLFHVRLSTYRIHNGHQTATVMTTSHRSCGMAVSQGPQGTLATSMKTEPITVKLISEMHSVNLLLLCLDEMRRIYFYVRLLSLY